MQSRHRYTRPNGNGSQTAPTIALCSQPHSLNRKVLRRPRHLCLVSRAAPKLLRSTSMSTSSRPTWMNGGCLLSMHPIPPHQIHLDYPLPRQRSPTTKTRPRTTILAFNLGVLTATPASPPWINGILPSPSLHSHQMHSSQTILNQDRLQLHLPATIPDWAEWLLLGEQMALSPSTVLTAASRTTTPSLGQIDPTNVSSIQSQHLPPHLPSSRAQVP
jgi:hypothetical protein